MPRISSHRMIKTRPAQRTQRAAAAPTCPACGKLTERAGDLRRVCPECGKVWSVRVELPYAVGLQAVGERVPQWVLVEVRL
jgi:predicted RNA-binding Zn-ribbon protein involved in translation (DUF1610 family)